MRNVIKIVVGLSVFLLFFSCKKEAGPGGKNTISGTVRFVNGVSGGSDIAPEAKIFIAYGTDQSTGAFDQTVLAKSDGTFKIEGLKKGKYFIKAEYTDEHGFRYTAPGYGIEFNHRKKTANADLLLE
jgi:hypothetical protein